MKSETGTQNRIENIKEIAVKLLITLETIKKRLNNIYRKLNLTGSRRLKKRVPLVLVYGAMWELFDVVTVRKGEKPEDQNLPF